MSTLINWQVVIMRPSHQARPLANYVEESQGRAILLPMLDIVALPIDLKDYEHLCDAEVVVISSPNAIQFAPHSLITLLATKEIITLGNGTTKALSEQGISVAYTAPNGSQSETLLTIEKLQALYLKHKNCALLAGKGGRDLIETTLASRCGGFNKIETYAQCAIKYDLTPYFDEWKKSSKRTCFIATSGNILKNLLSQAPENEKSWVLSQPLVVIGPRIEQAAIGYGFQLVFNSNGADMASLTKALQKVAIVCNTTISS